MVCLISFDCSIVTRLHELGLPLDILITKFMDSRPVPACKVV